MAAIGRVRSMWQALPPNRRGPRGRLTLGAVAWRVALPPLIVSVAVVSSLPAIASWLLVRASARAGLDFRIGVAEGSLLSGRLVLRDLSGTAPGASEPFFRVASAACIFEPLELASGHLRSLTIDGLRIDRAHAPKIHPLHVFAALADRSIEAIEVDGMTISRGAQRLATCHLSVTCSGETGKALRFHGDLVGGGDAPGSIDVTLGARLDADGALVAALWARGDGLEIGSSGWCPGLEMRDGQIDALASVRAKPVAAGGISLEVHADRLLASEGGRTIDEVRDLDFFASRLDPGAGVFEVSRVFASRFSLEIAHDAADESPAAGAASPLGAATSTPPMTLAIDGVALDGASIAWRSRGSSTTAQARRLRIDGLRYPALPTSATVEADIALEGLCDRIALDAHMDPGASDGERVLEAHLRLDDARPDALVGSSGSTSSAPVSATADLFARLQTIAPGAFAGDMTISRVEVSDRSQRLLALDEARASGVRIVAGGPVEVARVDLLCPEIRVQRGEGGAVGALGIRSLGPIVARLLALASSMPAGDAPGISIGGLRVAGGHAVLDDRVAAPGRPIVIDPVDATLGERLTARISAPGLIDSLRVDGGASDPMTLSLDARGIALARLSPYTERLSRIDLLSGIARVEADATITPGAVTGSARLIARGLQVGGAGAFQPIERGGMSPAEAIDVLRDEHGIVDLRVPIEVARTATGTAFSAGGAVSAAISQAVRSEAKKLVAPLTSLFSTPHAGGDPPLAPVLFEPGSTTVSADRVSAARVLLSRDDVRVEIRGAADAWSDAPPALLAAATFDEGEARPAFLIALDARRRALATPRPALDAAVAAAEAKIEHLRASPRLARDAEVRAARTELRDLLRSIATKRARAVRDRLLARGVSAEALSIGDPLERPIFGRAEGAREVRLTVLSAAD